GRVVGLPVPPANYRNLRSVGGTVYYLRSSSREPAAAFEMYDLAAQKETNLGGGVNGFEIAAGQKKVILDRGKKDSTIARPKGPVSPVETLNLSGLEVTLDRRAEWRQIFHECWRQMRDFFYDPNMHGVDWKAVRDKYAPLVEHVNHRADLTYLVGEM